MTNWLFAFCSEYCRLTMNYMVCKAGSNVLANSSSLTFSSQEQSRSLYGKVLPLKHGYGIMEGGHQRLKEDRFAIIRFDYLNRLDFIRLFDWQIMNSEKISLALCHNINEVNTDNTRNRYLTSLSAKSHHDTKISLCADIMPMWACDGVMCGDWQGEEWRCKIAQN
eukprot:scaffold13631_cov38-Cyclotella_meneghiniana.AAC.11